MHPIHDVDIVLLMATALSSKRRPAELVEIMAAADLLQGAIPSELKLVEAFYRLSTQGLLREEAGSFSLTPEAQEVMAGQRKKEINTEARIFVIKEKLSVYSPAGEHPPITLTAEQLGAAILAHRSSAKHPGRNLLMPKPKAAENNARGAAGHWRKPAARQASRKSRRP